MSVYKDNREITVEALTEYMGRLSGDRGEAIKQEVNKILGPRGKFTASDLAKAVCDYVESRSIDTMYRGDKVTPAGGAAAQLPGEMEREIQEELAALYNIPKRQAQVEAGELIGIVDRLNAQARGGSRGR